MNNARVGLGLMLAVGCSLLAAVAAATPSPEEVVRSTTDDVIERVKVEREALRADPNRLRELVDETIVPHFDFPRMSQWVLGKYWNEAAQDAQAKFIEEFKRLLVRTYATALLEYSDQIITYYPAEASASGKMVTVKTEVGQSGATPIPIVYRMHVKDGNWKVFDVAVDGVSLVSTYRASFASEIRKGGLDTLIDTLTARNEAPPPEQ
jgi:phospholipid transport system substrate-binding protein